MKDIGAKLKATHDNLWDATASLIREAYVLGREHGKAEAAAELKARISNLLEPNPASDPTMTVMSYPPPPPPPPPPAATMQTAQPADVEGEKRAPRGSVRPAVINALRQKPGLRPSDIAEITGLNENSIRGALNALAGDDEKITEKRGDLWYLRAQTETGAMTAPALPPSESAEAV